MTATIARRTRETLVWVLIIPLALGVLSFWAASRYRQSISWVLHTQAVLVAVEDLMVTVYEAESSQRGYLLTGEEAYQQRYLAATHFLSGKLSSLRELTSDNPRQQANLDQLSYTIRARSEKLARVLALRSTGQLPGQEATLAMREGSHLMERIRQIASAMTTEETRLLTSRTRAQRRFEIEVVVCFALGILVSIALLYFAYKLIRQYGWERDAAEAEVRQLNRGLQARIEERTTELKEANERLSRSNKDLTQFAYVASHDLQEPLRTVGSYAGLLGRRYEGKLDEQADKYIRFIVDGAKRMQALVQDLLAYSRVGTAALKIETLDMGMVLEKAKENLYLSIAERRATITNNALPRTKGDAGKLVQVFQNLISNSIRFAKPGQTAEVHIAARRHDREWIFSVRDNGIGFDPKYAERIFIIFQRLHAVGTYPGTGIGLAICQRIIEAHGGRIWAESEPEVGSTFSFALPLEPQAVLENPVRPESLGTGVAFGAQK